MILTCPACATRYQADESKFPSAGRSVRCAKCGHVWHQMPPTPALEPGSDALFAEEPQVPEPEVSRPQHDASPPEPESQTESETSTKVPEPAPEPEPEPEPRSRRWRDSDVPEDIVAPPASVARPVPRTSPLEVAGVGLGWIALIGVVLLIGWAALTYREAVMAHWPQSTSLYAKLGFKSPTAGLFIEELHKAESYQDGQSMLTVTGTVVNRGSAEIAVPQIRASLVGDDHRELYHWTFSPAVLTLKPGQSTRFTTRVSSPPPAARNLDMRFARAGE